MKLLKRLNKDSFKDVYRIMEQAFPKVERRPYDKAIELLKHPNYCIFVCYEQDMLLGFIADWTFNTYHFIEHFAIDVSVRGTGIGTRLLKDYVQGIDKPVILEVEANHSDEAIKRIAFYNRLGFVMNDYQYFQPSFYRGEDSVLLNIMSYPNKIGKNDFGIMQKEIFTTVYNKMK